jgi:competence protein ComEC
MPFGIEKLTLVPMSWGIDAIAAVGHAVTSWPGAVVQVASPSSLALALIGIGGLWVCIWLSRWRWWGLVPIALGLANMTVTRPPDLLVAGDMKLIAVKAGDGSYLPSTARGDAAVMDTWTRRAAARLGPVWPGSGGGADGALQCDSLGCFYRARGETVAVIRDGAALAEDCHSADLVVSPVAARRTCRVTVQTVRDWQGERLWSPFGRAQHPLQ